MLQACVLIFRLIRAKLVQECEEIAARLKKEHEQPAVDIIAEQVDEPEQAAPATGAENVEPVIEVQEAEVVEVSVDEAQLGRILDVLTAV